MSRPTIEQLLELVRQPNPTDPSRWDIAPGKHKAFSEFVTELQHRREAEAEPFCYVREWPASFDPQTGGEPASIYFSDVPKPGYEPLFKVAASPASGVRVKALEWFELTPTLTDNRRRLRAEGPFQAYHANEEVGGAWSLFCGFWGSAGHSFPIFGSEAEAKAAAQADYEARILSALGEHP